VAWADWGGSQGKIQVEFDFFNFNGFQNLACVSEILQGDLEGIWTWVFFLNSSMDLNDF
jgi:hypothetical protein